MNLHSTPDFLHALSDGVHRLPVIRVKARLHPVKLIPRFTPSGSGKGAQIIKGTALESQGLDRLSHDHEYINFVWGRKPIVGSLNHLPRGFTPGPHWGRRPQTP